MSMELEFWNADSPKGERLDFARVVAAWQIVPTIDRYKTPMHVMIVLRHTSRQRGAWIIWVKHGYTSATMPAVGPI